MFFCFTTNHIFSAIGKRFFANYKIKIVCTIAYVFLCNVKIHTQNTPPKPYGVVPNKNQRQWESLETYGFIHFGINTFTDKEWGFGNEDASLFNPTNFDANQIVKNFKNAGFKGLILTTKHHDGFCLWQTKSTQHNISKSPWRGGKGDIVKEISEACKKYKLKFGVYLSPWDRNAISYGSQQYVDLYKMQLQELLTQFGPVFETWHDGANGGDGYYGGTNETRLIDRSTYYNWKNIWTFIHQLQSKALIFGDIGSDIRWVGTEQGFAGTPCWATFTPESLDAGKEPSNGTTKYYLALNGTRNGKFWMPAEVDFSIRPGWFWHENENKQVKNAQALIKHYYESVGRGASMLLNVPPDKSGRIYKTDSIALHQFGNYIKKTFSKNLAQNATIKATNIRANNTKKYGTNKLIDNNRDTYFSTDDSVLNVSLNINLKQPQHFNIIRLREYTPLGQRIDSLEIDALINNTWQRIAATNSIGFNRLIKLPNTIFTQYLNVHVIRTSACVAISDFALFNDSLPSIFSTSQATLVLPHKAFSVIYPNNDTSTANIFDGDPASIYTNKLNNFKHIILDIKNLDTLKSLSYLPCQDNDTKGIIEQYEIYTSMDLTNWSLVIKGEFANIKANPIKQVIIFQKTLKANYLKFEATKTSDKKLISISELYLNE